MPTIAEIRQKFPVYNDLSDADLTEKLHAKFYSDMPRAEFNKRVGFSEDPAGLREERGVLGITPEMAREGMRGLGMGTRGVISGLASVPAMVGDAANSLVNLGIEGVNRGLEAGGAETRVPKLKSATQAIEGLLDQTGLPKPKNEHEELLYAINRGGASGLSVPGLGMAANAAKIAAPGGVGAKVIESATAYPIGQGVGMAAAEGGMKAMEQSGVGPLGQAAGGMAIGMAAPLAVEGLARGVGRVASEVLPAAVRPFKEGGREQLAGEVLRRSSANPETLVIRDAKGNTAGGALADAAEAPPIVPGSAPTTAQAAADPGLAVLERAMMNDPQFAGMIEGRKAQNNRARIDFLSQQQPGTESAEDVRAILERNIRAARDAGDTQAATAQEDVLRQLTQLGEGLPPEQAGAALRGQLSERAQEARQATGQAYRAIDPNDQVVIDPSDIYVEAADAINRRFGRATEGVPANLSRIVSRLRSQNLGYADLKAIRSELGEIGGKAGTAGDRNLAGAAGEVREAIDRGLERSAASETGFSPEQAQAFREATRLRREEGRLFGEGPSGAALKRNQFGREVTPDSGVAQKFWFAGSGSPEAARQLTEALGTPQAAQSAIAPYAIRSLRDAAVGPDGTIDPRRWRRWMDRHSGSLSQFPELRQQFTNVARAQQALDDTIGRNARSIAEIEDSAASYFLRQNPADAIASIAGSKDSERLMNSLMNQLGGDEVAERGVRRAILNYIDSRAASQALDMQGENVRTPAGFNRAIQAIGLPTLRAARFQPSHINNLLAIGRDLDRAAMSNNLGRAAGSNTAQNMSMASLLSSITGNESFAQSPTGRSLTAAFGWLYKFPDQEIRRLLMDAALDPAIAKRLVEKASPQNAMNLGKALKQRAAALGMSLAATQDVPDVP